MYYDSRVSEFVLGKL